MNKTRTSLAVLALFSVALLTACSDNDTSASKQKVEAVKQDMVTKEKEVKSDLKEATAAAEAKVAAEKEKIKIEAEKAKIKIEVEAEKAKANIEAEKAKASAEAERFKEKAGKALDDVKDAGSDAATAAENAVKGAAAKTDKAIQDTVGDGKAAPASTPVEPKEEP